MNEFMEAMKKEKIMAMSDVEINHDRNESHKVDINFPAFTIYIGGKTLLEDVPITKHFAKNLKSFELSVLEQL